MTGRERLWQRVRSSRAVSSAVSAPPVRALPVIAPAAPAVRAQSRVPQGLPCIYLGKPTGETVPCTTCKGTVNLRLFACGLHGDCFPAANKLGLRSCATCADYAPPAGPP